MKQIIFLLTLIFSIQSGACLEPMVSDDVAPLGLLLPEGTEVPSVHDDPKIEAQVAAYDGVDGRVPLINGFAEGYPVKYWDFGPTVDFAAPVVLVMHFDADGNVVRAMSGGKVHNTIIDSIPGDSGYSPYWTMVFLETTDTYNGELITSFAAIEEAVALGIVKPPVVKDFAVNCPAVAKNVSLEVGGGNADMVPSSSFYWKGKTLSYYNLGKMPVIGGVEVPIDKMYVLHREGHEPLSEVIRGVDITGDKDISDTNNIFTHEVTTAGASPLCRTILVTVPQGYKSIDNGNPDYKQEIDMFNPTPRVGRVIAFEETDDLRNCPQQLVAGGL